jgi:hypothetical protein
MWYGYNVNSTSHLGNILSIGTKSVNVYTNKVLLFYIFISFFFGGGVHIKRSRDIYLFGSEIT